MALDLTLSSYTADITRPLMAGDVEPEGIDLTTVVEYPPRRHRRFFRHGEFDAAEVSLASYLSAQADPERYSGSEAKAHPFRGGMKPTTGNLSTLIATVGVGCLCNIFR